MSNLSPENEDFRSVKALIGRLDPDELRIMHEQIQAVVGSEGYAQLRRLVRLELEQQTRILTSNTVKSHAEYAHAGGLVAGLSQVLKLPLAVAEAHKQVQARLMAERDDDGEK